VAQAAGISVPAVCQETVLPFRPAGEPTVVVDGTHGRRTISLHQQGVGMVSNIGDIRAGMDVFGIDGISLGTVIHAWVRDNHLLHQHDFSQGVLPPDIDTHDKGEYFLVSGGEVEMYVSFDVVAILFPGENVTVSMTVEECRQHCSVKPSCLV
jgi:hypothetical protein